MLHNLPRTVKTFSSKHKDILNLVLSDSFLRYITALAYAIFPIIVADLYNEWVAGLFFGVFNLISAFLLNPIVGNLADKYGSKPMLIFYRIILIISGIVWLVMPVNLYMVLIFMSLLFLSYSLRVNETYVLRVTNKSEGGLIFGISENVYSIAYFLSTLSIAFFTLTSNHKYAAWMMIIFGLFNLISVMFIKNDFVKKNKKEKRSILSDLNPFNSIKSAMHFVRMNGNYPLMTLSASAFQGIFYGTIWFIFPLYLAQAGISSIEGGLQLGIYELVTIFIAGICGYMADKYNWKHIHSIGWFLVMVGVMLMPFFAWPLSLIIIGFVIGVGNNMFVFAAEHALEAFDIDHKEDGAFMATNKMVGDFSYGISPVIAGFLYFEYGFEIALMFSSFICILLAIWMIWLTYRK